jgi:hypothetical protein
VSLAASGYAWTWNDYYAQHGYPQQEQKEYDLRLRGVNPDSYKVRQTAKARGAGLQATVDKAEDPHKEFKADFRDGLPFSQLAYKHGLGSKGAAQRLADKLNLPRRGAPRK